MAPEDQTRALLGKLIPPVDKPLDPLIAIPSDSALRFNPSRSREHLGVIEGSVLRPVWAESQGQASLLLGRIAPHTPRAGLADLRLQNVRGAAATRLFLAGLTVREIAETMGWAELQVERLIDTYVKRDEIILARIAKLDENADRTKSAKLSAKPDPISRPFET